LVVEVEQSVDRVCAGFLLTSSIVRVFLRVS